MGWRVVVLGLVVASGGVAVGAGPVPCPDVRFVSDVPIDGASRGVVVVDSSGQVAIPGFCAGTTAHWKSHGASAVLRAVWPVCGAASRVRLRMRYDAVGCGTATGLLRARATPRVRFTAVRSTCGDQYLDGGEACELTTPCASAGTPCIDCQCDPTGSTTTTTTLGSGTTTTTAGGLFEAANPWNVDVSGLSAASESSTIITALSAAGGWGNGATALQIDFSLHLLHVDATTPFRTFAANPGYTTPDCDAPFPFPLPVGGAIEGQPGYSCNTGTQDCHLLVVDAATKRLYEMYQANLANGTLSATCALTWDLTRSYPPSLRGEQCTSADAAGFPIGALLFTADEVAAGEIAHAIRFILPNNRMRAGVYVHPASHAGAPSGGPDLPPYGVRFRLRPDFPVMGYPANAQVILRAMQKYGMLLADGGNVALTAASDTYTTHSWSELGIDSHALFGVAVTDMEVVDLGPTIPLTYDCVRNP